MSAETQEPTKEVRQRALDYLRGQKPGKVDKPLFLEVARLFCLPIVELVPVRVVDNEPHVLCFRRPDDDPVWPGQLHIPGTIVLATDPDSWDNQPQLQRICDKELPGIKLEGEITFAGMQVHHPLRGTEIAQIYVCEVQDNSPIGEGVFVPVSQLDEFGVIDSQHDTIRRAVEVFKNQITK